MLNQNDIIELKIETFLSDGMGLARHEGLAIFVENAIVGQKVKAKISKLKKNFAQASIVEILEKSEIEQEAKCKHFEDCGGCSWQNINYDAQLFWKNKFLYDALTRIAKLQAPSILPTIASPNEFFYRNKMEFAFSDNNGLELGLHKRKSHELVEVTECFLQSEISSKITNKVRELCKSYNKSHKLSAWNKQNSNGFLRFLIIRKLANEYFVELICSGTKQVINRNLEIIKEISQILFSEFSEIKGFIYSVRNDSADIAYAERTFWQAGQTQLIEKINELDFYLGNRSFFQVNTEACALMYEEISKLAISLKPKAIWDIYCGLGSIGLYIANKMPIKLVGLELSSQAIKLAQRNTPDNIEAHFVAADANNFLELQGQMLKHAKPDLAIVDPPRAGISSELCTSLNKLEIKNIIYVSCDQASFARDITRLDKYSLVSSQAVDLFPQTPHIESINMLKLR